MYEREIALLRVENERLKRKVNTANKLIDHLLEKQKISRFDAVYEKWCVGCLYESDCHKSLTMCEKILEVMEDA